MLRWVHGAMLGAACFFLPIFPFLSLEQQSLGRTWFASSFFLKPSLSLSFHLDLDLD